MKIFTQEEFERAGQASGVIKLESGDFRQVDFKGRNRVVIGPHSILGDHAHLGIQCEIGHHTDIGRDFKAEGFLQTGAYCRFGEGAHIGPGSCVGRRSSFLKNCTIVGTSELGDHVDLPDDCSLFGVDHVLGDTLLKIGPVDERVIYAFAAQKPVGVAQVHVAMPSAVRTLDEFEEFAVNLTYTQGIAGKGFDDARQLLAAAKFIRSFMQIIL